MSRIGKLPIEVPAGVEVSVSDELNLSVKGPKGDLVLRLPEGFRLESSENRVVIVPPTSGEKTNALWGLFRSLLKNAVQGVSESFRKELEVVGVGYRVQSQGPTAISLSLGFSHPVIFNAPEGINFEVREGGVISVIGHDKTLVGRIAATIRQIRPPEPYKGKGIRYLGEKVVRKAGKSAKVGG